MDEKQSSAFLNSDNAPWLTKHVASILAISALSLSFMLFFTLIFVPLQTDKENIIIYILGVLSAIDTQIISFYFGSSKDSEIKNRMIQHQIMVKDEEE